MAGNNLLRHSLMIVLIVFIMGCSSANKARIAKDVDPKIEGELTEKKVEQALRVRLEREREFLQKGIERYKKQVVSLPSKKTTYYCKYYEEFPEDVKDVDITVSETGSLSPAYRAEVKFRKIRYQTIYTKSKSKAERDDNFIRDEGIQKSFYVFDGNVWRLGSSIFDVTKTSVYDENGWTPSRGRIGRVEEEKPELFVDKIGNLFGLGD